MILSHRKNRGVLTGAGLAAIMALTAVSAVGMLGWKVVKQATNDSSTPEATVQSFVSDLNASKYAEAAALIDGNSVTPEMMKLFAELKSEAKNTPGGFSVTLSDVTSKAEVNRATDSYLIHIKGILYQSSQPFSPSFRKNWGRRALRTLACGGQNPRLRWWFVHCGRGPRSYTFS